jgi:hypothetical protein
MRPARWSKENAAEDRDETDVPEPGDGTSCSSTLEETPAPGLGGVEDKFIRYLKDWYGNPGG